MNAFFASNRLSAYIDGTLSDAEMAEVEQAIRESPEVRAEYSRMLSAVERLREQGPMQAPAGFSERLSARLALEKMPRRRFSWLPESFRSIPLEAMGLAFSALLVVFLIQRDPVPEQPADLVAKEEKEVVGEEPESKSPVEQEVAEKDEKLVPELAAAKPVQTEQASPSRKEAAPNKKESRKKRLTEPDLKMPSGSVVEAEEDRDLPTDWEDLYEQAGGPSSDSAPTTTVTLGPMRYRLHPKSPDVLWQIQKLAQRFEVRMSSSSGESASPFSMTTEKNYANIKLQMSPARLEAFVEALKDLGAMTLVPQENSKLYSGGMMELELEIQFEP
jgi:negative regulator of sigma E activity